MRPASSRKNYFVGAAFVALAALIASCAASPAARSAPRAPGSPLRGFGSYTLDDPLPLAPELVKKTLDNGLTYYVRANGNPGGRITMFLVVAGGSSVEGDDELGYAHFVEHMAFNGTVSFPENELVRYLRSIGMEFGAEINAYTAIEHTVYMLEMPTDKPEFFETGLKVLREWATAISFDPVEVEKEKGVIIEEMRLGRGPAERARREELLGLLGDSRQARREPIGTEESVRGATAERLRAFYERSYRADRMAVMVVGDLKPARVAEAIEREFSFPNQDGLVRERPFFPVRPAYDLKLVASYNADFEPSTISYQKLVPLKDESTIGDYVDWLKKRIAVEAIKLRLSDLSRRGGRAWSEAYFDDDYFYGRTRLYAFFLSAEPGSELAAFNDLAIEVERLRLHGFTDSEFRRVVDFWRRWVSTLDVEDEDLKSMSFAEEYVRNFMYDEPVPGVTNERVYIRDALDALTLADLHEAARAILADDEGFVAVRAKAPAPDGGIDRARFEAALEAARAAKPAALEAPASAGVGLFDGEPEGGAIVSERQEGGGVTSLVLSNGARVLLKPTDYDKDAVQFAAWSRGGFAAMPEGDYLAALFAPSLLGAAGLGDMDAVRVQEVTAIANVSLAWSIGENSESFSGRAASQDLRTLLRLVYLNSMEPGSDEAGFRQARDRLAAQIGPYAQDPSYRFETAWTGHLYGDRPRTRPLDAASVRALDFAAVRSLAVSALGAASDFTYVLVGDFKLAEAKALAARYLGAVAAGEPSPSAWIEPFTVRGDGPSRRDYPLSKERRASVRMVWGGPAAWSWEREQTLSLMAHALNNRLLDAIREDLGATYVTSTASVLARSPVEQALLVVSFDCDPERVEELISEVRSEVAALAAGLMNPMYAQQVRANAQREVLGTTRTNQFWVRGLLRSVANDLDFELLARERGRPALSDPARFAALAAELLKPEREFTYVLLPEGR